MRPAGFDYGPAALRSGQADHAAILAGVLDIGNKKTKPASLGPVDIVA